MAVQQPVDIDTTAFPSPALFRDIMSPESLAAKETTQHMDIAENENSLDSMGLSEDSPAKEAQRNFVHPSDRIAFDDAATDP